MIYAIGLEFHQINPFVTCPSGQETVSHVWLIVKACNSWSIVMVWKIGESTLLRLAHVRVDSGSISDWDLGFLYILRKLKKKNRYLKQSGEKERKGGGRGRRGTRPSLDSGCCCCPHLRRRYRCPGMPPFPSPSLFPSSVFFFFFFSSSSSSSSSLSPPRFLPYY